MTNVFQTALFGGGPGHFGLETTLGDVLVVLRIPSEPLV